jgi:predicted acyltransferase
MADITKQRFIALDIFRGMTVCFMIIVNTGGPNPFFELRHAEWHGFTLTDLVFPSFLFAVGNALSFVQNKWSTMSNQQVVFKILKRMFLIFLIGYLMYWLPFVHVDKFNHTKPFPISETRIFGVLQRIALCYGVVALLVKFASIRTMIITAAVLLVGYWLIMWGFGDYTVAGNAAAKVDVSLIGVKHMYIKNLLSPEEPEGLLSTLPAIVNVMAGYLVGYFIKKNPRSYEMLAKLMLAGFAAICIAYMWNMVFPINKKLWTSSYALYTIGLDCIIIAVIIYIVDFLGINKGSYFFQVFGRNPLFIYLVSEVIPVLFSSYFTNKNVSLFKAFYDNTFGLLGNGNIPSLLFSLSFMMFCWLVGYILDKRKIYVRL